MVLPTNLDDIVENYMDYFTSKNYEFEVEGSDIGQQVLLELGLINLEKILYLQRNTETELKEILQLPPGQYLNFTGHVLNDDGYVMTSENNLLAALGLMDID